MDIKIILFNTIEYEQMIALRITALLEPIGVPASYIDREGEKNDLFIGALENKELIGCCVLTPKGGKTVQLRQMAVRKDHQGKRIGAALLQFAEATARDQGFSILMMHARDPVLGFYEKCGYQVAGAQFFEVGMGHHKMQKELS
jgi:GNAT superfamily N-acetyltransferase